MWKSARSTHGLELRLMAWIEWSFGAEWLIAAGAYLDFCSMKHLISLGGMLVHRRWLPRNLLGFLNKWPVHNHAPGWREALWELSVLPNNCKKESVSEQNFTQYYHFRFKGLEVLHVSTSYLYIFWLSSIVQRNPVPQICFVQIVCTRTTL